MNVILTNPITVILQSGFLVSEGDGIGTVQFTIEEQPVTLAITSTDYIYDTIFESGDRVKITEEFGILGVNSEGEIQEIIIDSTDDKASVLFNVIYPNQTFETEDQLNAESGDVSVLITVPLRILAKI